jgi:hypothetical protein
LVALIAVSSTPRFAGFGLRGVGTSSLEGCAAAATTAGIAKPKPNPKDESALIIACGAEELDEDLDAAGSKPINSPNDIRVPVACGPLIETPRALKLSMTPWRPNGLFSDESTVRCRVACFTSSEMSLKIGGPDHHPPITSHSKPASHQPKKQPS